MKTKKMKPSRSQQQVVMRRLRRRAFTLVGKLDQFSDLAAQIYPTTGIPSVENLKQQMMGFYSSGYDH